LKPAWANGSRDPISKKPITKKSTGGVAQGVGPEFKPQYCKTNKQKNPKLSVEKENVIYREGKERMMEVEFNQLYVMKILKLLKREGGGGLGKSNSRAQVAHSYNPIYSGSRDQEDCSSRQTVCKALSQKNLTQKGLVKWLKQV
jgi:hypothetical protein